MNDKNRQRHIAYEVLVILGQLSCTMVKAVHAVCNCMVGTGEGAVGTIDHRTVAEYKSSAGPDMYHLVVFDSGSGNIMASIYDNNTETIENYKLHQSSQDGAAVMMAMMPLIDWINSTEITGDPYRSALCTIISKATSDPEDRETLKTAILEPIFAPKRRRTA